VAGSHQVFAQQDPFRDHSRVPGMDELVTALDFEPVAYAKVPREAYNYMATAVDGEFTLRRNRQAFEWVELVPRAIADVSSVNASTEVLGLKMDYPIMVAPSAAHGQLHPDGELATHRGATAAGTPMIVSINASFPIDKIAAAAKGPMWWQLYARDTEDGNRELIERAQEAGCRAIVLTVDSHYLSLRPRAMHDRNLAGGGGGPANTNPRRGRRVAGEPSQMDNPYGARGQTPYVDWSTVDQLRTITKLPLLLKGILIGEDAKEATNHGVNGVIVSNHGARYLDYAPSTLEVLPEIVDAVGGKIPVLIDSGFRRGSDVLKALALGAKAVCLGRVPRWGLGAYGAPGVQRVLEILQTELRLAMATSGYATLDAVSRNGVRTDFP
jgi:isopentenyl diphosphate isomerase/L-lactate dehydrogenase-like FMN-dependent dehydrogenase